VKIMLKWSIRELELELKFPWALSRGVSEKKTNLIIKVGKDDLFGEGEIAFNDRYDESKEDILKGFNKFIEVGGAVESLESLINIIMGIEIPASLRFGIESAFVHYLSALSGKAVHQLLGVNRVNSVETSFSIPIMPIGQFEGFISEHNLGRFSSIKIKVNDENCVDAVTELRRIYEGKIRIDANEAWKDPEQVLKAAETMLSHSVDFIEQPMPAWCHDEYLYLKKNISIALFADESLTFQDVNDYYKERFDGVNIKLMKSGGYMKALQQIKRARDIGLKTMMGCMIETSLGISSAINVAFAMDYYDLDGCLLIKDDPYNLIIEEKGRLLYSHLL
jgi:glutamate racemase